MSVGPKIRLKGLKGLKSEMKAAAAHPRESAQALKGNGAHNPPSQRAGGRAANANVSDDAPKRI
jgi:hypothetical protein